MSFSRQINLNTFSQLAGKFGAAGLAFLTAIILRRTLGLQGFGDYVIVFNLITLLVSLADFGTALVSVKEASQQVLAQSKILGNSIIVRLLLSITSLVIGLLVMQLFLRDQKLLSLFFLGCPLVILLMAKNTIFIFFHTKLTLYLGSLQEFFISFLLLASAILVNCTVNPLASYLKLVIFSYILILIPFSIIAFKSLRPHLKPDFKLMKILLRKSLPLGLVLSLFTIYSKIDTLILRYFTTASVVGSYGLSYKIYENLTLPAAYFMNSLLPLVAVGLAKNKLTTVKNFLQRGADLLIGGSLLLILIMFLLAPFLLQLITGTDSGAEILALRLLLLALPFACLNHLTGYTIIALGSQKQSLKIAAVALLFNFLANLFFIPRFSFMAAGFITVLTEALVLALSLSVIKKEINFIPRFNTWPKTAWQFIKLKGRIFE